MNGNEILDIEPISAEAVEPEIVATGDERRGGRISPPQQPRTLAAKARLALGAAAAAAIGAVAITVFSGLFLIALAAVLIIALPLLLLGLFSGKRKMIVKKFVIRG